MNPQKARERAEQEQADALEEARVMRQAAEEEEALADLEATSRRYCNQPYIFIDEISESRAEREARLSDPIYGFASEPFVR